MVITHSRSMSSPSVSRRRASSHSRSSPPQRKRITPQLQLFNEEEARLAAEGHRMTRRVKINLGRLISKGYKRERRYTSNFASLSMMYCFLIVLTETLLRVPIALKPHISSVTEKEVVNEHLEEIYPGLEKSKTNVIAMPFKEKGGVFEREIAKKRENLHSKWFMRTTFMLRRLVVFVLQLLLVFNAMERLQE